MEKKFKVGDKVRFNSEWGSYRFEDSLTKGEVVEISDITDCGSIYVKKYVEAHVTNDEIELVSRPSEDPKTAFLTELKELLTKYDAQIKDYEEYRIDIRIGNEWLSWTDKFKISGQGEGITPSNIFDYDK